MAPLAPDIGDDHQEVGNEEEKDGARDEVLNQRPKRRHRPNVRYHGPEWMAQKGRAM